MGNTNSRARSTPERTGGYLRISKVYALLGRMVCFAFLATNLWAQPAGVTPSEVSTQSDPGADGKEADVLNMDLDQLSNAAVSVAVTEVNPVVEAVSKKSESAAESPAVVQVITAKQIRAFGAKNLKEVLNWATSVYMTGSYLYPNNSISMRGDLITHNTNHVLPLINGRPFRDVHNSGLNTPLLMGFPLEAVSHIEIIRGPGSVLYGSSAYVGVINVVTKKMEEQTAIAQSRIGSFGTQQYSVTVGNGDKRSGYMVSGVYNRQQGWPFNATGEDHPVQTPAVSGSDNVGNDNAGIVGQYYNDGLSITAFYSNMRQSHLGAVPLWPFGEHKMDRIFLDAGYLWEHSDDASTDFHFTYNYHESTWPPTPVAGATFPANSVLFEFTHRYQLQENLGFMVGAFCDLQDGVQWPDGVAKWNQEWVGVYSQLEYQPTDWLKLVGGMQGNMPSGQSGGVAPRAAALVTLTDEITAKFMYGQAFRSPSPVERLLNAPGLLVGNQGLEPETISTFEHQLAYTTSDFRLAGTYFYSDYRNVISRVGAAPATYANSTSMIFRGIELESQYHPSDRWMAMASLTWQENVNGLGVEDSTLVPNWQGKWGVAYNDPDGLKVGLFHVIFSNPKSVEAVNPSAAVVNPADDSINLVSLDVRYDLSRYFGCCRKDAVEFEFLAQNLLDEDINHPEFGRRQINTLPMGGGASFYGGIRMQY